MKNTKLENLKKQIAELEDTIFYIEMIDHWTAKDSELYDRYNTQLRELKALVIEEITKEND